MPGTPQYFYNYGFTISGREAAAVPHVNILC